MYFNRIKTIWQRLLLLLLAALPMGLAGAQSPDSRGDAVLGGNIGDGNVLLNYSFGAESTIGMFAVPTGTNHLVDAWWWYRLGGDAAETRLPAPDTQTYSGNYATFTWTDVDGRGFDLSLTTTVRDSAAGTGEAGTAITRVTVTNPGGSPLPVDLFFYTNVNLAGTSASDTATLVAANNYIRVAEGDSYAELFGLGATAYDVDLAPVIRDALSDGGITNLSNSGLPFGPNDFSSAFQWTLNVAAGASTSIGSCLAVNHSCAGASVTVTLDAEPDSGANLDFNVDGPNPDPTFTLEWGEFGSGPGQFYHPTGIAVDANGRVYVSDSENDRVQLFSATGRFLDSWGGPGTGNGQFVFPYGIKVDDANGWVYVADGENNRVQKFDMDGNFLLAWGSEGSGNGQFILPADIDIDAAGQVYVADSSNHRIQVFDSSGNFQWTFGSLGPNNGEFFSPRSVVIDRSGRIYVADTFNYRVQRFDSSGNFELAWGSFGTGVGQFDASLDLALDDRGNVYVTDLGNERVQVFDADGTFLLTWGTLGLGDGQFVNVSGIALDQANNIYTTDTYVMANRVQRFASLGFRLDDPTVDDGDDVPNSRSLYDLPAGTWTVTLDIPDFWLPAAIVCQSDDPADSSSVDVNNGTATLDVDLGEHIACTYSGGAYNVYLPIVAQTSP